MPVGRIRDTARFRRTGNPKRPHSVGTGVNGSARVRRVTTRTAHVIAGYTTRAAPALARLRDRVRLPDAAPALLVYAGVRLVGLLVLWIYASVAGADFWHLLNERFDASWYLTIADRGYDTAIPVES